MDNEQLEILLSQFLEHRDRSDLRGFFKTLLQKDETTQTSTINTIALPSADNTDPTIANPVKEDTVPKDSSEVAPTIQNKNSTNNDEDIDAFSTPDEISYHHTSTMNSYQSIKELSHRYHIKEEIGRGGMGRVLRVVDPKLRRQIALKIMDDQFAFDVMKRDDFEEEAQISSQLQHPGIVPIYDFSTLHNGNMFFTMREIEGRTLKEIIQNVHHINQDGTWRTTEDGWNIRRMLHAFCTVCETVAYAHSRGVVHCDLKPANIMVGDYGEVLVLDWGIAKVLEGRNSNVVQTSRTELKAQDNEGWIKGTPAYMSPEQAAGELGRVDERSDIYSLGLILFEILVGDAYFKGTTFQILHDKLQKNQPKPARIVDEGQQSTDDISQTIFSNVSQEIVGNYKKRTASHKRERDIEKSNIPNALIQVYRKAIQREMSERYDTVMDLSQAIHSWLEGLQRREKAVSIVNQAVTIEQERKGHKKNMENLWLESNSIISKVNPLVPRGWDLWEQSKQLSNKVEELQQEEYQLLQGALIYDPESPEIHRRLVQIEYQEYLDAILRSDIRTKNKSSRRISIHLENLPTEEENYWMDKKERDYGAISLLRKRYGIFVGRLKLKEDIAQALMYSRLVSLVGTAGVGKTHLALQTSTQWRNNGEREVLFCDLTVAFDTTSVAQILGKVLDITLVPSDPWSQIEEEIQQRAETILLVLDNVEQIVSPISHIITGILRRTSNVKIMVTSRINLDIEKECVVKIQPMSLLEAVELFVVYAQQNRPDFALGSENKGLIVEIVSRLDYLPLAIELAAARTSMISLEDILERLSNRFELLQGRLRDPQKIALQGALDWSWDLLSDYGKSALVQCSAFEGGFDLQAAEAIVDLSQFDSPPNTIDIIEALCDDHLIYKELQEDTLFRYGMLVSIHEYAREKQMTDASGDILQKQTAFRHAKYFAQITSTYSIQDYGVELNNFICATQKGLPDDAFICCQAALHHFGIKGPLLHGIQLTDDYLSRQDLYDEIRTPILMKRISYLRVVGRVKEAREEINIEMAKMENTPISKRGEDRQLSESVDIQTEMLYKSGALDRDRLQKSSEYILFESGILEIEQSDYLKRKQTYLNEIENVERLGKTLEVIQLLQKCAQLSIDNNHEKEAIEMALRACALAKKWKYIDVLADGYFELASMYKRSNELKNAVKNYKKALHIYRQLEQVHLICKSCREIGALYHRVNKYDKALVYYNEALGISRDIGIKHVEGLLLGGLGDIYRKMERFELAKKHYELAIQLAREFSYQRIEGINLGNLGYLYEVMGESNQAIVSLQEGVSILEGIGDKENIGIFSAKIGLMYRDTNQFEQAISYLTYSISIAREHGAELIEGLRLGILGELYSSLQRFGEAKLCLNNAVELCREKNSIVTGNFRGSLAIVCAHEKEFSKAQSLMDLSENEVKENIQAFGKLLCKKAQLYFFQGEPQMAQTYLEQSLAILENHFSEGDSELEQLIIQTDDILCTSLSKIALQNAKKETEKKKRLTAEKYIELAHIEELESSNDEALAYFHKALRIYEELDYFGGIIKCLVFISHIHRIRGEGQLSLTCLERVLSLQEHIENEDDRTKIYTALGKTYDCLGQYDESIQNHKIALSVAQKSSNLFGVGIAYGNLGSMHFKTGKYEMCIGFFEQAIQLARDVGDRRNQSVFEGSLALALENLGRYEEALQKHINCAQIFKKIGDRRSESIHYGNIGNIYRVLDDYDKALENYLRCLDMIKELKSPTIVGIFTGNLGDLYLQFKQYGQAEDALRKSISICETKIPMAAGAFKGSLALLLSEQGKNEEALLEIEQGEPLVSIQIEEYGKFLCKKVQVLFRAQQYDEAERTLVQAEEIYRDLKLNERSELSKKLQQAKDIFLQGIDV